MRRPETRIPRPRRRTRFWYWERCAETVRLVLSESAKNRPTAMTRKIAKGTKTMLMRDSGLPTPMTAVGAGSCKPRHGHPGVGDSTQGDISSLGDVAAFTQRRANGLQFIPAGLKSLGEVPGK